MYIRLEIKPLSPVSKRKFVISVNKLQITTIEAEDIIEAKEILLRRIIK